MTKKTRNTKSLPDSAYAVANSSGRRYLVNTLDNAKKSLKAVQKSRSNADRRAVYLAICDRYPGFARTAEPIKKWRARSAQKVGRTLSRCAPRKKRKAVKRAPKAKIELTTEWVLLGINPVIELGTGISPGSRYYAGVTSRELLDYALVVDDNGELQLVLLSDDWYDGPISEAAETEFSERTFRSARRRSLVGMLATKGPFKLEGYIMGIGYTGTLQGVTADYFHEFDGPPKYIFGPNRNEREPPQLFSGPDGYRIKRGNSNYRVTDRGIVG